MSDIDVNKIQQNVKELQDQNFIDFQQWKKLGKDIEKLSEKIKLSDTNLIVLMKKIKNDYEKLKKIIVDENVQVQLNNKIEKNKNDIIDSNNKIEKNINEINKKVNTETFQNEVDEINSNINNKVGKINSQMDNIVNLYADNYITDNILDVDSLSLNLKDNTTILFPRNIKIKINKPIQLRNKNNVSIQGNFSEIEVNGEFNIFDIQGTQSHYCNNIAIEKLTITGYKDPTYTQLICGIKLMYVNNILIRDCIIQNIGCSKTSAGSIWLEYVTDGLIENCKIYNSGSNGIVGNYCTRITVRKVLVDDTKAQNAFYFPREATDILVDNCVSLNAADGALEFGDDTKEDLCNMKSSNCICRNSYLKSKFGVYLSGGANHKLIGNTIIIDSNGNFGGVSIQNNSYGAQVLDNTIINKGGLNSDLCIIMGDDSQTGDTYKNAVIKNNKIYGKGMLIHFKSNVSQGVEIIGNTFSSLPYATITSLSLTDNTIEVAYYKEFNIDVGDYGSIDNELVKITSVVKTTKTTTKRTYDILRLTIERGQNNTTIAEHKSNNLLYIVGNNLSSGQKCVGLFCNKSFNERSNIIFDSNKFVSLISGIVFTDNVVDLTVINNVFTNTKSPIWTLKNIKNSIFKNNIEEKYGAIYNNNGIFINGALETTKIFNNEMKITLNDSISNSNDFHIAPPTQGNWNRGDVVKNYRPVEQGTSGSLFIIDGWTCTTSGTPGTWVENKIMTGN